MYYFCST